MSEERDTAKAAAGAADFGVCLVEGSAADRQRGKKIKRRAIAISVLLESAGLTALVIAPMLAKPAEIRRTTTMPIPPYRAAPAPPSAGERAPSDERRPCVVCPAGRIAPIPSPVARGDVKDVEPPDAGLLARASGVSESFLASEKRNQPERPVERPPQKTRLYDPHISPALLTHRVEPVFPPLAQQLRRSGKVELHALIAANGTIESLQVVSGDPMFLQSAIDAVKQWRYQPTLLNGHPVEVDTFITVIYTLDSR